MGFALLMEPPYNVGMNAFNLEEHLRREHKRNAVSEYLREIVYGGNDGIVTTFAVVSGFAGAQSNPMTNAVPVVSILLFGLANLFADGLSMALGSFLSLRADQDVYRSEKAKEHHEIIHDPGNEYEETVEILKRKKFTEPDARAIATIYRKNTSYWTEFMMKDELEMPNPEGEKPHLIAVATFISFIVFGSIPLLPYIFRISGNAFGVSIGFTAFALLTLGVLRASVTKRVIIRGIVETMLLGSIAASAAYFVGTFFRL